MPLDRQPSSVCGVRPHGFTDEVSCQLPERHNSPHSALDGTLTWEPAYASDLRREVEDLQQALAGAVGLLETSAGDWDQDDRDTLVWLQRLVREHIGV